MTLKEAREILGLGQNDDPSPHLHELNATRERIAEMARSAPNQHLAARYKQELTQFDQALTVIREHHSALKPTAIQSSAEKEPVPIFAKAESLPRNAPPLPSYIRKESSSSSGKGSKIAWIFTLLLLATAAVFFYLKYDKDQKSGQPLATAAEITELTKKGNALIENRTWPEATRIFDQIEKLNPQSTSLKDARERIAAGMAEEQSQFVGYWTGQAKALMEAKRWDEATAAARQVQDKIPNEKESTEILKQISEAKAMEAERQALVTAREMMSQRKWDEAIATANQILASRPADEEARTLLKDATEAKEKAAADQLKAKALFEQARAKDQGQFNQEVVDLLREANALSPEDPDIKSLLDKMSSYSRTIRVPGDFATPVEALAQARDKDHIIIAAGTWDGPLVINAAVNLEGAGPETTIIQCEAKSGNAISIGPGAKGAHVTGLTFHHISFDPEEERYSAALVRGATADFINCRFTEASGHGLAVIEGGHVEVSRCRFTDNGWDGIAASGAGTLLEVRESESLRNFNHGIESWDGAAMILTNNRCIDNSRNGVHADNGGSSVTLEKNQFSGNREFGVVLSSAGSGRMTGNTATNNMLGGIVIRKKAGSVTVTGNEATKNGGPGLVLDLGLSEANFSGNTSVGNSGQQILANTDLTVKDEPILEAPKPAHDVHANPAPISGPDTAAPPRAVIVPEE